VRAVPAFSLYRRIHVISGYLYRFQTIASPFSLPLLARRSQELSFSVLLDATSDDPVPFLSSLLCEIASLFLRFARGAARFVHCSFYPKQLTWFSFSGGSPLPTRRRAVVPLWFFGVCRVWPLFSGLGSFQIFSLRLANKKLLKHYFPWFFLLFFFRLTFFSLLLVAT